MKLWKWGKGRVYRFIENRGFSLQRDSKRGPGTIIIERTIGDTTSGRQADDRRVTTIHPDPKPNPKPTTSTYSQQFENVWAAYPRKSGKKAAWKVWKKEKLENIAGQILSSLELQKKSVAWAKDGGQFIPAGSTWFNGARWEDELDQLHVSAPAPTNGKRFDKDKYLNGIGMNPMLEGNEEISE